MTKLGDKYKGYTNEEKNLVLDDLKKIGNKTQVAKKHGLSRQTLYDWIENEEEIRASRKREEAFKDVRERVAISNDVLDKVGSYSELMAQYGTMEERKKKLGDKLELTFTRLADMLENHPDLAEQTPKDMSRILTEVYEMRRKLANEPDIVIEYRNRIMENAILVLKDLVDRSTIEEFVGKMEAIEAEYEVL